MRFETAAPWASKGKTSTGSSWPIRVIPSFSRTPGNKPIYCSESSLRRKRSNKYKKARRRARNIRSTNCWNGSRLVAQPQPQIDAGVAVILHDAADKDFRSRYSEILSMGCRDLRVGIVQPTGGNYGITHMILVDRPPKRFSTPGYWIQSTSGWGSRAIAFYRCFVNEDFPLYIEMGYEHPVLGLDRLYDISAERAKGIFVYGKDPTEERMVGNQEENNSPHWIIVGSTEWGEIFSIPDKSLSLEPAKAAPRRFLKPRESEQQDAGVLQLRVQRDTKSLSTTESIEGQLAWHQQAIEELQREHRESRALRRDSVYLAYEFHQPLNGENGSAPTLSLNFSRLLDQPFSQLSHFRYGFFTHPSNKELGLHVVIDERPSTFAQTWTRLADEVYIQRNDWFEWNLPLFIRNGDTLRPRLEDEHMVRMVRTVIWEDNEHPFDQPVLLKTLPRVRDRARRSGERCGFDRRCKTRVGSAVPQRHETPDASRRVPVFPQAVSRRVSRISNEDPGRSGNAVAGKKAWN